MNLYKENESGRSMVEMLGVLAIIGVLSVAGIAGYTSAMNRHRANELLNAVAMRTVVLAAQRASGTNLSLSEFGNEKVGTSAISVDKTNANNIVLTLTNVPAAVCKNMYNTKGANVVAMTSNGTALTGADDCVDGDVTITFNNDLSTVATNSPEAQSGPKAWQDEDGKCDADKCLAFCLSRTASQCFAAAECTPSGGASCSGNGLFCTDNHGDFHEAFCDDGGNCNCDWS